MENLINTDIESKLADLTARADVELAPQYRKIDETAMYNTSRVMTAFKNARVSEAMFAGSTGYGYDDVGRTAIDKIYAELFSKEAAFVRSHLVSGTHTLTVGLFGLLRPGDTMLSVTGKPYDTLDEVIGIRGKKGIGTLIDFGVKYSQNEFKDGKIDFEALKYSLDSSFNFKNSSEKYDASLHNGKEKIKIVYAQRSKGYLKRRTLSVSELDEIYAFVKKYAAEHCLPEDRIPYVFIDNCYGELVEKREPCADVIAGSLIKNPGGGMADCGGYIAGTEKAVELCGYRLTSPGIGTECGATVTANRNILRGIFYAPHTVAQAEKTSVFAAYIFEKLGFEVEPSYDLVRSDIIQAVILNNPKLLIAFCRGIQSASPVDSYVTPEPWAMPGYDDPVIMAAGTFVSGASIELSADGPIKAPYIAYFQGGLTYESGKLGIISAAREVMKEMAK